MLFLTFLSIYQLFCVSSNFRIVSADARQSLNLKKTIKHHQTKNIIHEVNTRDVKQATVTNELHAAENSTRKDVVQEISGNPRQFPPVEVYPNQPIAVNGPFHHVHFVPKPYPVESVRYVPRPVPIPYAIPTHVHVSHLHLRPKCEYDFIYYVPLNGKARLR